MGNRRDIRPETPLSFRIVRYGLFVVLLLPFIVLTGHLFPKEAGKAWVFMAAVAALFPFAVYLAARYPRYRPPRGPMTWAVLGFIAVMGAAALLGADPERSFWSTPSRLTGVLFLLHATVFYLMATQVWRGLHRPVIGVSVAAAAVSALIGAWQAGIGGMDRADGMFANAVFLAQYLVPHVFLAVWLAMTAHDRRRRNVWLAAAGLLLLGVVVTKSRAGMVGLLIGSFTALILLWRAGEGHARRIAGRGLFALALLLILFIAADRWAPTHAMLYERRMSFQNVTETVGPRLLAARAVWQGALERPVLGWGPENTGLAFDRHYDPELLRYDLSETRWDRAHSILLEQFVAAGIIGVLAYFSLFAAAAFVLFRPKEGPEARWMFYAAPAALFGVDLFLFGTATSWMLLFLFFALCVPDRREKEGPALPPRAATTLAAAAAVLSLLALMHGVVRPWTLSSRTDAYLSSLASPPPPAALMEKAEAILDIESPYASRYARLAAPALRLPPGGELNEGYARVAMRFAEAVKEEADRHANDYDLYLGAAKAAASVPLTEEAMRLHEESIARMRELSPRRQETEWLDGFFLARQGRFDEAEAAFERAISFDPEADLSHEMLETYHSVF